MKFKNIFFILYSVTILYCYNVFAFEGSEDTTASLSFSDKVIVLILCMLVVILIKGFKIKKEIQE